MAFSHFTVDRGVCFNPDNRAKGELHLPSCPLLTFDLALLHLLSTSTLALMLVVLSTVLAPGYHLSHSTSYDADAEQLQSSPKGGGLVLWDLALAPIEQGAGERERLHVERYGATEPETSGSGSGTSDAQEAGTVGILPRDKFAEGRVTSYGLLLACSLGVVGSAAAIAGGDATGGSPFILAVGAISSVFSTAWWVPYRCGNADPAALHFTSAAAAMSLASWTTRSLPAMTAPSRSPVLRHCFSSGLVSCVSMHLLTHISRCSHLHAPPSHGVPAVRRSRHLFHSRARP